MSALASTAEYRKPVVPDISPGVARLFSLLSQNDVGVAEVAEELKLYPVVVARLIGLANSAWSSPATPVLSLNDACARLGLSVVKSTAIAYAVSAPFNIMRCPTFDATRFWCGSLLASEAARVLADLRGINAAIASTAGMLRNIGLLWLADIQAEQTAAALMATDDEGAELGELLRQSTGMSHVEATVHLMGAWGFSQELQGACDPSAEGLLTLTVHNASTLADLCYLNSDSLQHMSIAAVEENELQVLSEHLQIKIARTLELAETIAA